MSRKNTAMPAARLRHAGLFSGIGGFSLAARRMGWANVFEVEKDDWCRQVLHKNFPESELYDDVYTFDGLPFRGRIDVLSGGFPCQPWSSAGQRKGTADDRHLWPEFLRIIRQVQPRFVVGENVRGLLSWGAGVQFETVCTDLEAEGYDVQPLLLPACGVGAHHKRDRVWFVAHATGRGRVQDESTVCYQSEREGLANYSGYVCTVANTHGKRQPQPEGLVADLGRWLEHGLKETAANAPSLGCSPRGAECCRTEKGAGTGIQNVAPGAWRHTEPPLCAGNDGVSGRLVRPNRAQILKAAGNAIVPQLAYEIFQAIEATDSLL